MLRCVLSPRGKFMKRVGTLWDVWAKETLMFPGVDSAAASVGLVACPSQDDSQHIRSLKSYLYAHAEDLSSYMETFPGDNNTEIQRSRYVLLNQTRALFCKDFAAYLSVNGDFKEVSWAEALTLKMMNAQPSDPYMKVVPAGAKHTGDAFAEETILFQRDYLSSVITTEEEKTFSHLANCIVSKLQKKTTEGEIAIEKLIPSARRFTKEKDNTKGDRTDYSLYRGDCPSLIDSTRWVDDVQGLDNEKFIEVPHGVAAAGVSFQSLRMLNSARLIAPQDSTTLVNTRAFKVRARDGENNDNFSKGMAEVMHLMKCNSKEKGCFRVTVPVMGSEFPVVDPSKYTFSAGKKKKWRRINPLYISKEQRKNMSGAAKAQMRGSKMHRRKVLKLDPEADNEDILEKQHYDTCRLALFLATDSDKQSSKRLSDAIYEKLLCIRARQKANDALVN